MMGTGGTVCTMPGKLRGGAWTQKEMPEARAGKGETSNAPSARVLRPHPARLTLLIFLGAADFRFEMKLY